MARLLRPKFEEAGHPIPLNLRVSVGFPSKSALSPTKPRVGECWYSEASTDKCFEIFISPTIGDGLRAADILVHELCHAVLPYGAKHGPKFAKLARTMGLEGKPTATVASEALVSELSGLMSSIGAYPHAELRPLIVPKKQSTRMLKLECPQCGYVIRTTQKWLDLGTPVCACGETFEADQ